jgi:5-methyltetrahydropteroyltriglutamate--homocysteine methyltransferase
MASDRSAAGRELVKRSIERILTSHTGSLPRPNELLPLVFAKEAGKEVDAAAFDTEVFAAVSETVRKQVDARVDVLNDGEMSKPTYATYVKDRLSGFTGEGSLETTVGRRTLGQGAEFPDFTPQMRRQEGATHDFVTCDGPVSYENMAPLQKDIENLEIAVAGCGAEDVFMSAASPGVIAMFAANRYFPTEDEYLQAVADAMRQEYEAIVGAGFTLQLDCPDLALPRVGTSQPDELKETERRVEILNYAVANIPAEDMRAHVCWGNGEVPRNHDVPLADIIDVLLTLKPAGLMLMAANGAHEHEWKVFEDVKLPDGKYLVPGVIDCTTNIIEHPEVVAQRLVRYAAVVGRENVMAGTDCGFGTAAGVQIVAPSIAWAKLQAMGQGAQLASQRLW